MVTQAKIPSCHGNPTVRAPAEFDATVSTGRKATHELLAMAFVLSHGEIGILQWKKNEATVSNHCFISIQTTMCKSTSIPSLTT